MEEERWRYVFHFFLYLSQNCIIFIFLILHFKLIKHLEKSEFCFLTHAYFTKKAHGINCSFNFSIPKTHILTYTQVKVFVSPFLHLSLSYTSEFWMLWGKRKKCLILGCLENISIVNDSLIGKLNPINLNNSMDNTIKQECSTWLANVWICLNKFN